MRHICTVLVVLSLPCLSHADSLKDALTRAWARAPAVAAQRARESEVGAKAEAASSVFAAAPALTLNARSDRLLKRDGAAEYEAEIGLPLRLSGEKAARQAVFASERSELGANALVLRLNLAGELRETAWAAKLALNELELTKQRGETAKTLEQDVARRTKAGELARTDLNLAKSETLAAQSALLAAQTRVAQALKAYAALTGSEQLPEVIAEASAPASVPSLDQHPLLEAQRQLVASARARYALATILRRDAPELAFSARRERGGFDEPYANTIGVKLRFPLATQSRNAPLIAAANTELATAEADYTRERVRIELEIDRARRNYDAAAAILANVRVQHALAAENLKLFGKAFGLGALDLPGLLRARAAAFEAELAHTRQQIEVEHARAGLHQAQGVLP